MMSLGGIKILATLNLGPLVHRPEHPLGLKGRRGGASRKHPTFTRLDAKKTGFIDADGCFLIRPSTLEVDVRRKRHLTKYKTSLIFSAQGPTIPQPVSSSAIPIKPGSPIPCDGNSYWNLLPSIHSANFWEKLEQLLCSLHSDSDQIFSVLIQPQFSNGVFQDDVIPSRKTNNNRLEPLIENFEAQSGDGLGPLTDSTYICVTNVTSLPEPQALPISSSQANVEAKTSLRHEAKLERKRAGTVTNVQLLNSINSMSSDLNAGLKEVVQAIQSSSTTQSTSIPLGVNWTPIIQGLVSGVATSLGATLSFPSSTAQAGTTTQAQTPSNGTSGEEGPSVIDCRALITNISSSPNPSAQPFSSDPSNLTKVNPDENGDQVVVTLLLPIAQIIAKYIRKILLTVTPL
uniref:Uncharacterized protein n=5 Tax=Rhizophagus TaxID=1129544 RepID=U9SF97_RHIID